MMAECRMELMSKGKPSPRTCAICGLGPCQNGFTQVTFQQPSQQLIGGASAGKFPPDEMKDAMRKDVAPAKGKDVTINLTYYPNPVGFKVTSITNSASYVPGQFLPHDTVQMLCGQPDWTVNIVDNDMLAQALSLVNTLLIPKL